MAPRLCDDVYIRVFEEWTERECDCVLTGSFMYQCQTFATVSSSEEWPFSKRVTVNSIDHKVDWHLYKHIGSVQSSNPKAV